MTNEKKSLKLIAKLIGAIHRRAPRQALNKFSEKDVEETLGEIDQLEADRESRKAIDARAAERCFGQGDLRKNYAGSETDPGKVMTKVLSQGRPVIAPRAAVTDRRLGIIPEGKLDPRMAKVMGDRFDRDKE